MKRPRKVLDLARAALQRGLSRRAVASGTGPLVIRRLALIGAMAVVLSVSGCQEPYSGGEPPPDEALVRAMHDKPPKTVEQAAHDYFYPTEIDDYFKAMDTVGLPAQGATDWPLQLLDKPTPSAAGSGPRREVKALKLTEQEAFGRNAWMIWCAGNDGFWDWLANNSFGSSDFLKLLDSHDRGTLFRDAGLINEPEMIAPGSPEATDFGVRLSVPSDPKRRAGRAAYLKEAFDRIGSGKYPDEGGYGSYDFYGSDEPPPGIYGLSSGVIGLRLFPNPKFDKRARERWDAKRYYDDPKYYGDPDLVRPFRVGMSCAFCHASFHPLNPPRDITDPGWENLSGNIGAQYLRIRGVFGNLIGPESFVYHVLDSQPPGTVDTSLIPSDNINNANAMNSIFGLPERVVLSFKNPREQLNPTSAALPSLWPDKDFTAGKVPKPYLDGIPGLAHSNENPRYVPRILFDGADSVGTWAALSRVFLNIGEYWEQWIRIHNPLVGFRPQQPFRIDDCKAHSVYWNATQLRVGALRDYFLRITPPMRLTDVIGDIDRTAPIDAQAIRERARRERLDPEKVLATERARRIDKSKLKDGRRVFAHNCIVCHSSIQPQERFDALAKEAEATGGEFWEHDPGRWLSKESYRKWAEAEVEKPEFWLNNFLSADYRIPINLVRTNSARAMATNAMADHMWSDFSSASYHSLPSVGSITYFNPFLGKDGAEDQYTPRHKAPAGRPGGGGPGFYRVPSLISIWTCAPLLHNNSLGLFNNDPSVDGRLLAFDDAIRKLLWLERRFESSSYNEATPERLKRDHGLIWRTPVETHLTLPAHIAPAIVSSRFTFLMHLRDWLPWLADPRWLVLLAGLIVLAAVVLYRSPGALVRALAGYLPLVLALVFGLLICVANGWLGDGRRSEVRGLWLLPLGLIVLSWVVLLFRPRGWFRAVAGYLPLVLALVLGFLISFLNGRLGDVRIGPIPKGTPVNLLASINPEADPADLKKAINITTMALGEAESKHLNEEEKLKLLREKVAPALMKVSRCPDFVMDQGHYYEWFKTMTDADKDALIELLKTF